MNTLYFKYAIEVEQTGSITQAAENLFMAQPNLSKAIKELEDTLGITIFERNSKGVIPTKKGIEFLKYAKNVLRQINKMEALAIDENDQKQSFRLVISKESYVVDALVQFIAELDFKKEIEIYVKKLSGVEAITAVNEGIFDLGLIECQANYETYFRDYLQEKNISYDLIWEFKKTLLISKDSPLVQERNLAESTLSHYTEILTGKNSIPYLSVNHELKIDNQLNKKIYITEQQTQLDVLSAVPQTYMWEGPIAENVLCSRDLVQRYCDVPNNSYKDLLIYSKGYKFSQLDKKFIDKLYAKKNKVAYK